MDHFSKVIVAFSILVWYKLYALPWITKRVTEIIELATTKQD